MCQTPSLLPTGELVACRKCWQCDENRINDWVGRCVAASKTASKTHSVTLTYGRVDGEVHHPRSAVLTYSDVQKYFKKLRRRGHKCSYLAVGEYGSKKGRAHWHLIIFWKDTYPEISQLRKRINEKHWTHGFSEYDDPTFRAVRYVCKYINKDVRDGEAQFHMAMSKQPPIGHAYFQDLAQRYVDAGLSPNLFYQFDGVTNKKGQKIRFRMGGTTARNFLTAFIQKWRDRYGNNHWPQSDVVDAFEDKQVRDLPIVIAGPRPRLTPNGASVPYYSYVHDCYCCMLDGIELYWHNEDRGGISEWRRDQNLSEIDRKAREAGLLAAKIEQQSIDHMRRNWIGSGDPMTPSPRYRRLSPPKKRGGRPLG